LEEQEQRHRKELEERLDQLTQQKHKEIKQIQQQHLAELNKVQQQNQQQIQKLQQQNQEQKQQNQQLMQQMQQLAQQMQQMQQQNQQEKNQQIAQEEQLKQTVTNKLQQLHQEQQLTIEKTKQEYNKRLLEKETQISHLTTALKDFQEQKQQEIQQSEQKQHLLQQQLQQMQKEMQQNTTQQKQLEQRILSLQQQNAQYQRQGNSKSNIQQQWQYLEQIQAGDIGHHKNLVQKFSSNADKGAVVPALDFFDNDFKQNLRQIMQFHKMQFIAYPSNANYFITIEPNTNKYQKRTDFQYLQKYFSNRSIAAEYGFPHIIQTIQNNSRLYSTQDGRLSLAIIFPPNTADYIAWKSTTVCKKHNYDPKDISICSAYFRQSKSGFWSMIIHELTHKNGQRIPVKDFEATW